MASTLEIRKTSSVHLFGLPLYDIAIGGAHPQHARGIVAIGQVATGVIAIGPVACGFVAIGAVSLGVFAVGAVTLGGLLRVPLHSAAMSPARSPSAITRSAPYCCRAQK